MEIVDFQEIAEEFDRRVSEKVWCSVATVDRAGRPRSRVLHPIWDGCIGWVGTYPGSHKSRHLEANPYVSCSYVDSLAPVYVDCRAEWVLDVGQKRLVWELMQSKPAPYGFDPGLIWPAPEGQRFGVLKLIPWRLEIYTASPGQPPNVLVWRGGATPGRDGMVP